MIKRFITNQLRNEISEPEINILLGARQVGKTTILRELERYAQNLGLTTAFFDLEQSATLSQFNKSEAEIFTMITSAGQVVFIDEFQYIKNASKIFKAIFDARKKVKIFCSGSSSLAIHKHLKESLAGRRFRFHICPLSYTEITTADANYPFKEYLRLGGMPALWHTNDDKRKQTILNELLNSYIIKDIKSLVKEENIRAFNHLLYLLAERQGSLLSLHSLASEISMSAPTVQKYLDILEETYIAYRIHSYSTNLGNELKKSHKAYIYDLGIRNALVKDFSPVDGRNDKGILPESFVFLKLHSLLSPNKSLRFWRTKAGDEVDFIFLVNRKPIPIEVKSKVTSPEIPQGLERFLLRYPKVKRAYVVNETLSKNVPHNSCTVEFITFEDFANLEDTHFD